MSSQKITINVVRRTTCLISRNGFYLRVTDDSIEGSQNHAGDVYTALEIASVAPGELVLRGEVTNRYIGMDSNGNIGTYSSLLEDCIFKEHHNMNGYSSFESRPHSGWYLALTNDGRAKPGPKTAPGQRAVEFLPENV